MTDEIFSYDTLPFTKIPTQFFFSSFYDVIYKGKQTEKGVRLEDKLRITTLLNVYSFNCISLFSFQSFIPLMIFARFINT